MMKHCDLSYQLMLLSVNVEASSNVVSIHHLRQLYRALRDCEHLASETAGEHADHRRVDSRTVSPLTTMCCQMIQGCLLHSSVWNGMCCLRWNRVAVAVAGDKYSKGGFALSRLCHDDDDTDNLVNKPVMNK